MRLSCRATASAAVVIASSAIANAALQGTAEISGSPIGGGVYHYTITLHNTGTTTIGSLWFSWIPGENFMTAVPTSITSPASWTGSLQGGAGSASILWQANTAAARLAAGGTLNTFTFNSTHTPAQMDGLSVNDTRYHVTDSYIYSAGALSDAGYLFTMTVTPAPSAAALAGIALVPFARRSRRAV
jgi:hypothetical protein